MTIADHVCKQPEINYNRLTNQCVAFGATLHLLTSANKYQPLVRFAFSEYCRLSQSSVY